MKDVMIDAEWLGERICSVALVMFDPATGQTGSALYRRIKWNKEEDQPGKVCDPSTVYWWFTQSATARDELTDPQNRYTREQAAEDIRAYLRVYQPTEFWQRGDRDREVLEQALYHDREVPWQFYQWNDVRTLTKRAERLHGYTTVKGNHNALGDCYAQIKQVVECWQ